MKTKYPSKKRILAKELVFKPSTIETVLSWKGGDWKESRRIDTRARGESQVRLCLALLEAYGKEDKAMWVPEDPQGSRGYWDPDNKTLTICGKPSVITALHETAHAIYGPSELQACRWSVQLFRKCFPRAYKKLKWKGHLLVANPKRQ